jgi:hypothetical protein
MEFGSVENRNELRWQNMLLTQKKAMPKWERLMPAK